MASLYGWRFQGVIVVLPVKSTGSPKGESNWRDHLVASLHGAAVFVMVLLGKIAVLVGAKAYLLGGVLLAGIADGAIEIQSSVVPLIRSLGGWWVLVAAVLVMILSGLVQRYGNNAVIQPQNPMNPPMPPFQPGVPAPPPTWPPVNPPVGQ